MKSNKIVVGMQKHGTMKIDVDVLLRTRMLVQAASGAGKSHLLRRLIEQLFGRVQIFVIDHEGEFSTLRPKYDFVLIGEGGDAVPDVRTAGLLANRLLECHASTVFDLSEAFRAHPQQRRTWVKEFLSAMMEAPRHLWHPVVVIVDEAHKYNPEKDEAESSDAMTSIATDGRKRQFCAVWATQRLAKLNKDAAAELLNKMIGGTSLDIDRKRAADDLGVYGKALNPFYDEIKVIERGYFYALGPAICNTRTLVHVGETITSPPRLGRKATVAPPPSNRVKALLPKLADLPKEVAGKVQTEAELRKEIRELKIQLRTQPKPAPAPAPAKVERKPITEQELSSVITPIVEQFKRIATNQLEDIQRAVSAAFKPLFIPVPSEKNLLESLRKLNSGVPLKTVPVKNTYENTNVVSRQQDRDSETLGMDIVKSNGDVKLRGGALRMLATLAQWYPNGITEGQLRGQAGLKKSGTYSTYMSMLRSGGYMKESNGLYSATESGLDQCQHVPPAPKTTEEVLAIWQNKIRGGARRMLDVLVQNGGEPMTKDELFGRSGLAKSGTASTYLSTLKSARLIQVNGDQVNADRETLFL